MRFHPWMAATKMRLLLFETSFLNLPSCETGYTSNWTICRRFPKWVFFQLRHCQISCLTYKILLTKTHARSRNTKRQPGMMSKRLNIFYEITFPMNFTHGSILGRSEE